MIYLASPYTHPDAAVREQRFDAACKHAGKLIADGHYVFSPIVHSHPIAVRNNLPGDFGYWRGVNMAWLRKCDSLHVLMISGWGESRGVKAEIDVARSLGLDVKYVEPGE